MFTCTLKDIWNCHLLADKMSNRIILCLQEGSTESISLWDLFYWNLCCSYSIIRLPVFRLSGQRNLDYPNLLNFYHLKYFETDIFLQQNIVVLFIICLFLPVQAFVLHILFFKKKKKKMKIICETWKSPIIPS